MRLSCSIAWKYVSISYNQGHRNWKLALICYHHQNFISHSNFPLVPLISFTAKRSSSESSVEFSLLHVVFHLLQCGKATGSFTDFCELDRKSISQGFCTISLNSCLSNTSSWLCYTSSVGISRNWCCVLLGAFYQVVNGFNLSHYSGCLLRLRWYLLGFSIYKMVPFS